jgi:hypothetical protein
VERLIGMGDKRFGRGSDEGVRWRPARLVPMAVAPAGTVTVAIVVAGGVLWLGSRWRPWCTCGFGWQRFSVFIA